MRSESGAGLPVHEFLACLFGKALPQPGLCVVTRTGYAGLHRDEVRWYVRKYARESSAEVVDRHISLYVNDYSRDIGEDGQAALDELLRRAHIVMKEHG